MKITLGQKQAAEKQAANSKTKAQETLTRLESAEFKNQSVDKQVDELKQMFIDLIKRG